MTMPQKVAKDRINYQFWRVFEKTWPQINHATRIEEVQSYRVRVLVPTRPPASILEPVRVPDKSLKGRIYRGIGEAFDRPGLKMRGMRTELRISNGVTPAPYIEIELQSFGLDESVGYFSHSHQIYAGYSPINDTLYIWR